MGNIEYEITNAGRYTGVEKLVLPEHLTSEGGKARYVNSALWVHEQKLREVGYPEAKIVSGWQAEDSNYETPTPPEGDARESFFKEFGRPASSSEEAFSAIRGFMNSRGK